jgi:hypothetical protein
VKHQKCPSIIFLFLLIASFTYGQEDTSRVHSYIGTPPTENENSNGLNIDVGASLVRNTITPTFNFNLHFFRKNKHLIQAGTSTNFFFEKGNKKKFTTLPNTFIKLELYWKKHNKKKTSRFDNSSWHGFGIGYLAFDKGDYFSEPTFKVYHKVGLNIGFDLALELIITDDFKTYFPGITITFL